MTEQHWNEFLDKLDFVQLTGRWEALPLHWLVEPVPEALPPEEADLFVSLATASKEEDAEARVEAVQERVSEYRRAKSSQVLQLDAGLCPTGSRVTLRYLDPDDLGQGDCLITVGSWDRLGHYIAEKAGHEEQTGEPSESAVRKEPGDLAYRHLLIFPDRGTPSPRAFRGLCEKTLRQARGLGARRITITHPHLPQPGLPDRFAAAELVSAVRQMLRDGSGISVDIVPLTRSHYEDYQHWFLSLKALAQSVPSEEASEQSDRTGAAEPSTYEDSASLPDVSSVLKDLAQKTTHLAQDAGREMSSWLRGTPAAPSQVSMTPVGIHCTFDEQQALNLLYLRRWREAEAYRQGWARDTLIELYLSALVRVVSHLEGASSDPLAEEVPPPLEESEYLDLRTHLLATAERLSVNNPLTRYFQLLAWRLDRDRTEVDGDRLEEDHARLLRAAWAWEDNSLLAFLRQVGQERESDPAKRADLGYVPVFPSGSRASPRLD